MEAEARLVSPADPVARPRKRSCESAHLYDEDLCAEMTEIIALYSLWFFVYAWVSTLVVRRAVDVRALLNPVASGLAV